ncbi:MAG: hypothetical protein NXI30_08305 [bacterium]|nr:hypothetical protein [bacterium]
MRFSKFMQFALALAVAGAASVAGAQTTVVSTDVTTPTTWCDDETEMFLLSPIFVSSKLTIEPGCIIRGNPRGEAFDATPGNETNGAPGALIISQDGFLDAQGTASNPIIMTTGAQDTNGDNIADDFDANTFADPWDGNGAVPALLDDTPATNPIAPLDAAGNQNAGLWGGLVILGRAPTNLGENLIVGYGSDTVEGLAVPGFPAGGARYGGYQPHDSSGILRYVSVRNAGDEIGAGNELNGITLGGVGDGTIFEFVEVWANDDDGMEWFGGTVNGRNLVNAMIGDDSLDIDQGFSGNIQNAVVLQTFFNENGGTDFGAASGDNIGEWDGDDCAGCNVQIDDLTFGQPTVPQSWPNANPAIYNLTALGAADEDSNNPAVSPTTGSRGLRPRDGWTGVVANSIINNTNGTPCDVESDAGSHEADIVRIVASTFADAGTAPNANCLTAAANGDAAVTAGEYDGGSANFTAVTGEILVEDNYFFDPQGGAGGKMIGSKVGDPADPRPANPTDANVSGGVRPRGAGLDASATYRGAFPASQPLWTAGWTVLSTGGVFVE